MTLSLANPRAHRLFERTWRRSCPIRPRHSRARRWLRRGLMLACILLLAGYVHVTRADRVRLLAESYLERLVGGDVTIGNASLGLFDGLRLDDVAVRVDGPDATVFTARSVTIDYDPISLLAGHLSASRVVATDPHVSVVEDARDGSFNLARLGLFDRGRGRGGTPFRPPGDLPALSLRNAQVEYARRDGDALEPRGGVGIEAHFRPDAGDSYAFDVQTRRLSADGDVLAPRGRGRVSLGGGESGRAMSVTAELGDVDFASLADLLPGPAADWCRRHAVAGRVEVPEVRYAFDPSRPADERASVAVKVVLADGSFQALPGAWLSDAELAARRAEAGGDLPPLRLADVAGTFRFDDGGVTITGLTGDLEGNRLRINGVVGGYGPDAPLDVLVSDVGGLSLPESPRYVASLPGPVREVYDRFRPVGRAKLQLRLHRGPPGDDNRPPRPVVTGAVDVLDGTFALDRLPYPVHDARGRLVLEHDDGHDRLRIVGLRGTGPPGSPNADALLAVSGVVEPLGPDAGFDVSVAGRGLRHHPPLIDALPPEAQRAIRAFDPATHGGQDLPAFDFAADFVVRVTRPPGKDQRWDFDLRLDVASASGALEFFPYPLRDATATVRVRPDGATIEHAGMVRGDATVNLAGQIGWAGGELTYGFTVRGRDVAADEDLLNALPPPVAEAVGKLGLGGRADATIKIAQTTGGLDWSADLDVRDGRFWPAGQWFSLNDLAGRVRVTPDAVELLGIIGRRGEGTIAVDGTIGLGDASDLTVSARNLALEGGLYDLLPGPARDAWDWLRPTGTVDADVTYLGPTALLIGESGDLDAASYDVRLRPKDVGLQPVGFPYDLTNGTGDIRLRPGVVEIAHFAAEHPLGDDRQPATLALRGTGDLSVGPAGAWTMAGELRGAPVDDALLAALPPAVAETMRSVALDGTISARMDVLRLTTNADAPPDVAFDGVLSLADASADLGVELSRATGDIAVAGSYEAGRLYELSGDVALSDYALSGRGGTDLAATFTLPAGGDVLTVADVGGRVAGGFLDADVTLGLGEDATFAVDAKVSDVDLRRLLADDKGDAPREVGDGRLTAAVELEGIVGDEQSRQGRGSLAVEGRRLYDLPLVLGLLQVTNLALPVAEPFNEATARFALDGSRVTIESLDVRAGGRGGVGRMRLSGAGTLDYASGEFRLVINTDNRGWDAIPLVGELTRLARNEVVKVEIAGTLEKPDEAEVGGTTLPTIRGTLDRVLGRE